MDIVTGNIASDFMALCEAYLCEREVVNNLPLGLARRAAQNDTPCESHVVVDGGAVIAVALQTPPHNLVLAHGTDERALVALAGHIAKTVTDIPGIVGPAETLELFVPRWTRETGKRASLAMGQMIYELTPDSFAPQEEAIGAFAMATPEDVAVLAMWMQDFSLILPEHERKTAQRYHDDMVERIAAGRVGLWRDGDGAPVSMACISGKTENTARVGPVYTPTEQRGRGYAAGSVTGISRHLFDAGYAACCLYTDLSNPTSNALYRRIGYAPICASAWYEVKG